MHKKELLSRLWGISEGAVEDGDERVYRVLQLARCALAEGIDTDPLGYLTGQLAQRVYEEPAPGWLARALLSLWMVLGRSNPGSVVSALDGLLDDLRQDLALS